MLLAACGGTSTPATVDAAGDAQAVDASPPDMTQPPAPRRAFVTNLPYPTNFADGQASAIAFAEDRCRFWAAPFSSRPWVAWLSTSGSNAIDRFTSDGPWQRMDGAVIAANKAALIDGTLDAAIALDASGNPVSDGVMTGTGIDGRRASGTAAVTTCDDWTTTALDRNYVRGNSTTTDATWTTGAFRPACGLNFRFFCFEQ